MSKGAGTPCGGSAFAQYASYRPGVYFFARENCYILDIDNQLSKAPDCDAVGTATCGILIKTAPETDDYVKTGLYKTNQSFQVIDSPWRANGEATYSATGLEALKKYKNASWKERSSSKLPSSIKMVENDWANVYKTEEYNYVEQGVSVSQEKTATIYTVVFGGEVRYVFDDGRAPGFTYYTGNGYSKQSTANTQKIYVDLNAYDVLEYNITAKIKLHIYSNVILLLTYSLCSSVRLPRTPEERAAAKRLNNRFAAAICLISAFNAYFIKNLKYIVCCLIFPFRT